MRALLLLFLFSVPGGFASEPEVVEPEVVESVAVEPEAVEPEARGGEHDAPPPVREPFPFEHPAHERAFKRNDIECFDCHADPPAEGETSENHWAGSKRESCHGCHQQEQVKARGAASECLLCHVYSEGLAPESHGLGWHEEHGSEALRVRADCEQCHQARTCVSCHEARGALVGSPHGPGFLSYHGVEARFDPSACSTCHASTTCTTCHETGRRPW